MRFPLVLFTWKKVNAICLPEQKTKTSRCPTGVGLTETRGRWRVCECRNDVWVSRGLLLLQLGSQTWIPFCSETSLP